MKPRLFRSTPQGEERLCRCCENRGYGQDAWLPATSDFWPLVHGRLWFGRCRACAADLRERKRGVVVTRRAAA